MGSREGQYRLTLAGCFKVLNHEQYQPRWLSILLLLLVKHVISDSYRCCYEALLKRIAV